MYFWAEKLNPVWDRTPAVLSVFHQGAIDYYKFGFVRKSNKLFLVSHTASYGTRTLQIKFSSCTLLIYGSIKLHIQFGNFIFWRKSRDFGIELYAIWQSSEIK